VEELETLIMSQIIRTNFFTLLTGPSVFVEDMFEVFFERIHIPFRIKLLAEAVKTVFQAHWVLDIKYLLKLEIFLEFYER